ncbi:hypothetical protein K2X96_03455, partial [Patescibacteria group bacterium]|nr:hypothetical protein [Patescibacteria group bacterium]
MTKRYRFLSSWITIMPIVIFCFVQTFGFVSVFFTPETAHAAPNSQINYQGKLTGSSNIAVADGIYHMRFWLLTSPTAATSTAVWAEDRSSAAGNRVQVRSGLFSVMLGSSTPLTGVDFNQTLYLGVEIGGSAGSPAWDGEMSPRKVLGTVPAAFEAGKIDGLDSTQFLRSDAPTSLASSSASTLFTITQNGSGDILNIFDGGTEVFSILDGGNIGIGSTTPSTKLSVGGNAYIGGDFTATGTATIGTLTGFIYGTNGVLTASSTLGANFLDPAVVYSYEIDTSAELAAFLTDETGTGTAVFSESPTLTGNVVVAGDINSKGISWATHPAATTNQWGAVAYGNGTFVAVSTDGTGNRVMTSPDGINWTSRTSAADNAWQSVTYGNGLFVAVSSSGTGNRVMTSPDGITWTSRTSAADNSWQSVTYGNGLFVAVAGSGTGNRVMTSPDGISWTSRTSAEDNYWISVTHGNGLFVAVSLDGATNNVMTSPDGITWTPQAGASSNQWTSVTYGNGLFVAVSYDGLGSDVMTSPDGSTWTTRTNPADYFLNGVTYGNGLFVAVADSGPADSLVITSPDGINWTSRTSEPNQWQAVAYGNGTFVAVSLDGTNRTMSSGKTETNAFARNNSYQGGMNIFGNVGIGTTTPSESFVVQGNGLFTGNLTGANLTATGTLSVTATSTLANFSALSGTTTNLAITNIASTSILRVSTSATIGGTLNVTGASTLGLTTVTNATSTGSLYTTTLGVGSDYITDLTGAGLQNVGGVLTLNATGAWTGTFDGQEGSYYLANSFSTTSANTYINASSTIPNPAGGATGNLISWNGSRWVSVATSTLGFASANQIGSGIIGQVPYYAANGTTLSATSSLFIGANGNVGVGSTSPTALLTLTASFPQITFSDTDNGLMASINANNASLTYNTATANRDHIFQAAGNTLMTILGTGNVGIGTTTPDTALTVLTTAAANASGQNVLKLSAPVNGSTVGSGARIVFTGGIANSFVELSAIRNYSFGGGDYGLAFDTGITTPTTKMVIQASGNVGIGTTTPTNPLTVQGNANIFGNLSSANLSATGTLSVTGASTLSTLSLTAGTTTNFAITGISSVLLKTTASGTVVPAIAGTDYVAGITGDWTGTFDGQEGSYYLANSFSTTSANTWLTTRSTTNLAEGTNLYYTDARVAAYINASSTIPNPAGGATGNLISWNGS